MVGHGLAEGGLNQAPAHLGPREMHDEQLFPFEAAVRTTAVASIMPAYCDVDGVPCHASHELLTSILRDDWGFDGDRRLRLHRDPDAVHAARLTADLGAAAGMALRAGVDSELPNAVAYGEPLLIEAVAGGPGRRERCSTPPSDGYCVMKFRLGLFERPFVERADVGGR